MATALYRCVCHYTDGRVQTEACRKMHSMWVWGGSKRTERESEKEEKVWSETQSESEREREKDRKREGGTESAAHHYAVRFCFVVLTSMMEVLGIGRLVSLVG